MAPSRAARLPELVPAPRRGPLPVPEPSRRRLPGIPSHRLPQLDRVSFGVVPPREAALRIRLGVDVHGDAGLAELGGHGVEVADAEVDHPRPTRLAEVRSRLRKRREYGWPLVLPPGRRVVGRGRGLDAEMFAVPEIG